jgi:hypothetical protein
MHRWPRRSCATTPRSTITSQLPAVVTTPADRYTDAIARVRPDPFTTKKRKNSKLADDIQAFRSTRWHCAYCRGRIILPGIFYLVGYMEPKRFRYTPGHGYPAGDHPRQPDPLLRSLSGVQDRFHG